MVVLLELEPLSGATPSKSGGGLVYTRLIPKSPPSICHCPLVCLLFFQTFFRPNSETWNRDSSNSFLEVSRGLST